MYCRISIKSLKVIFKFTFLTVSSYSCTINNYPLQKWYYEAALCSRSLSSPTNQSLYGRNPYAFLPFLPQNEENPHLSYAGSTTSRAEKIMSSDLDPTKGLCALCNTISIPYRETLSATSDVTGLGRPDWEFKHGTVSYVFQSARRGCPFCFLLVLECRLNYLPAAKTGTTWLLLKTEGGYLSPKYVDSEGNVSPLKVLPISPWRPIFDGYEWVDDGQAPGLVVW